LAFFGKKAVLSGIAEGGISCRKPNENNGYTGYTANGMKMVFFYLDRIYRMDRIKSS